MFTKTLLALGLALAMTGLQACFYSGPSRWGGQGYQSTDPQYGYNNSYDRTRCDRDGYHCTTCDANGNNCEHTTTARSSWFIW